MCLHGGTRTGDIFDMSRPINPKIRDAKKPLKKSGVRASQVTVPSGPRKIGYVRVSTVDQNLDLQITALRAIGCTEIREEKASAVKGERPIFSALLAEVKRGDSIVVWKLDRAGRNARELLGLVEDLKARGVGLTITTLGIDTTTVAGKLFVTLLAGFAEFETAQMVERVTAGRIEAVKRGVKFGPRRKITPTKIAAAKQLLADPKATISTVARTLGVGRSTLYRAIGSDL